MSKYASPVSPSLGSGRSALSSPTTSTFTLGSTSSVTRRAASALSWPSLRATISAVFSIMSRDSRHITETGLTDAAPGRHIGTDIDIGTLAFGPGWIDGRLAQDPSDEVYDALVEVTHIGQRRHLLDVNGCEWGVNRGQALRRIPQSSS